MPEALNTEVPQTSSILARIRHEVAQSRGIDVLEELVQLSPEQVESVLKGFDEPAAERIRATEDHDRLGINRNVLVDEEKKRFDGSGIVALLGSQPGEVITLLKPADQRGKNSLAAGYAAVGAKTFALEQAAKVLGADETTLPGFLEEATANVYASPHNGSPTITERVIELPGGTIYEMNVHGAGDPTVVDAQVVAIRK